ncbi:Rhodopsin, GQ-coupled [Trichoplax sp. H2]|nr:Rhodopsin, GQ-coupled [Trichoplax sp. H2]|eukprot:RDD39648.1 Rhodopsin, GQ-coupled [Trichoplax sp. H2]
MTNLSANLSLLNITSATCLPVGIMGILTDFFLLVIISTSKSLKDPIYRIIANIMVCDCISCLQFFVIFLGLHLLKDSTFHTSQIYCKTLMYSMYSTYNVSALNLKAISVYRYEAVVKASRIRFKELELRKIRKLLVLIWATSCLFSIPSCSLMKQIFL